jgi:hypothetical protein
MAQVEHVDGAHGLACGGEIALAERLEEPAVGVPAATDQLGNGDAIWAARRLGQASQPARERPGGERCRGGSVQLDGPESWGQDPAERRQRAGLARAVRADQREYLAWRHAEREVAERVTVGCRMPHVHAAQSQDGRCRHVSLRHRTKRKYGPPRSASSAPTGSSSGAASVRAAVSVSTRSAAPASMESGRRTR